MAAQKKKPELATKDDLQELSSAIVMLKGELDGTKEALQAQARNSLDAACSEIRERLSSGLSKAQKAIDDNRSVAVLAQNVASKSLQSLKELGQSQASLDVRLDKALGEAKLRMDQCKQDLSVLAKRTDEGLGTARRDLEAKAAEASAEVAAHAKSLTAAVAGQAREELQAAQAALDAHFQQGLAALEARLRKHCEDGLAALSTRIDAELAAANKRRQEDVDASARMLRQEVSALDTAIRRAHREDLARAEEAHASSAATHDARLDRAEEEARRCFCELERLEGQLGIAAKETQAVRGSAEQQFLTARKETSHRLVRLEDRLGKLHGLCSQVGGIPTRQVEWYIEQNSIQALQESEGSENSLFSCAFDAAGACGLQLELQLGKLGDSTAEECPDCSVYLWAPNGLRLVFRLSVGSDSTELQHCFDGKAPCGAARMFSLAEHTSRQEDPLRVILEILEAVQELGAAQDRGEDGTACRPATGSLKSQQYLNHRLLEVIQRQHSGLLELVQRRMEGMRSRAIRRVQWRLDHASMLRQCFTEGRPICSAAFQAAGISGMQLVFYPSGCTGAKQGFCSLFISCPTGCSLRCWLFAGRWRREAKPEPGEKHDLLGRVNFCRFDSCVDPVDESVEVALEIEEAQHATRLPPTRATTVESTGSRAGEGAWESDLDGSQAPLGRTDLGAVRVQLVDDGGPVAHGCSPERVKQLPPIWTSHGFRSFSELRDERGAMPKATLLPGTSNEAPPGRGCRTPRLFAEVSRVPQLASTHKYKQYQS